MRRPGWIWTWIYMSVATMNVLTAETKYVHHLGGWAPYVVIAVILFCFGIDNMIVRRITR